MLFVVPKLEMKIIQKGNQPSRRAQLRTSCALTNTSRSSWFTSLLPLAVPLVVFTTVRESFPMSHKIISDAIIEAINSATYEPPVPALPQAAWDKVLNWELYDQRNNFFEWMGDR